MGRFQRTAFSYCKSRLEVMMEKISLNGDYTLTNTTKQQAYKAKVPGSILQALLENEAICDPFYRDNEYATHELMKDDFSYTRQINIPEDFLEEDVIELVCYGIDTLADIFINDTLVATTNNMHRTWRINVKPCIVCGENQIRVDIKSAIKYIENYTPIKEKEIEVIPAGCMKGNQYIRKAHSMFGWDWGPNIPDAGIWRDIELCAYKSAAIRDVYFSQIHEEHAVTLETYIDIENFNGEIEGIRLLIISPDGNVTDVFIEDAISAHKINDSTCTSFYASTIIENPMLWWPNGYGEHPLYQVHVLAQAQNGEILDDKSFQIGLRTLTISQDEDEFGNEFCFIVNGIKIFAMGANYIPEDVVYGRIDEDKICHLIASSLWANFNCLRIWGGGYYPSDRFYELCDLNGIVVWQDLMFACNAYELSENFEENIILETIDNVKRLRHHASLGLWCGNNEMESAWHHWGGFVSQKNANVLKMDYTKQFEEILSQVVHAYDEERFYWPSSPSSGGGFDNPDDETRGDAHYWDVWHGQKPFSDYRKHYFRFCSEFGFQSFPDIKTINTFALESDKNIFSRIMEEHQKNDAANGKLLYYLSENFQYPKGFTQLLDATQILQGLAIKCGVEHWRRNRGRCMGALYWQLNDNWPVASWSSIDYYGRYKALHYMAKKFFAPVAGSVEMENTTVCAWVANETRKTAERRVIVSLKTLDFDVLDVVEQTICIKPLSSKMAIKKDYGDLTKQLKTDCFVEVLFMDGEEILSKEVETFVPYKHINLQEALIEVEVIDQGDQFEMKLASETFAPFVKVGFTNTDALFSDNYVMITSDEVVSIIVKKEDIAGGYISCIDCMNDLVISSLYDTYL